MGPRHRRGAGWEIDRDPNGSRISARFIGHLDAEEAGTSAQALIALLETEPVDLRLDLSEMSGYDPEARTRWKDALWGKRHLIRSIRVVGGNALVRMGAQILGMVLGISVRSERAHRAPQAPPPTPP